jgi:hypothetical protein
LDPDAFSLPSNKEAWARDALRFWGVPENVVIGTRSVSEMRNMLHDTPMLTKNATGVFSSELGN